ncbi:MULTISPECIES: xylulokinase [unclassified Devosia]|uniref:xylulokinase n=1 Tax=unclassified Devosia TaxID=196773 RepID=UPI00086AD1CF|nr:MULTISPECIES: xylulokinase [unclassified Devosia]MBN9362401.1 xylulokinase [Devosia sp.]ODS86801.1 MAG: xylulokinase [Devosia sp. SCN 66-27]OJX24367.1 MAG: xylulokinase [Devosia sp. 66-14]
MTYLGIDIGTSGVKALLINRAGQPLGEATAKAVEPTRPHPGWSEQNPADWWNATLEAIDKLSRAHPAEMAKVRGIGLSGHMHGATLLDKNDQVLRPCILWNDGRSAAECAEMEAARPALRDIAGNIAMPGFTAPKIAWVRKHEPEIYARIAKVLLPKAYIRLLLTGEHIEEMSDASGTLWLDVGKREWSDELLALTGLNRSHMPRLVEGSAPSAGLKREFVTRWGMSGEVVVAGGAGDNAAAACGIGAIQPGEGFVSLGTSGVLFVSNDRFRPNTRGAVHAFCHAIPNTWHQMGVILSATDSLNWLAKITGQDPAKLAGAAEAGFKGPGEEIFLPYLSGERTPHNNAAARGSLTGLSHSTDPALLAQAVMEGVAFAFRDCQRVLKDAGTEMGQLLAVGGGSKSNLWLRLIATNLETEIALPEDGDFGGALGVARLGLCAAEGADPSEIMTMPAIKRVIKPEPALKSAYSEQYARYRALYPAIEEARK